MRARFLSLLLVPACLSSPDGVAKSWPPPLATVDVAAIVTGDLDGDGTSDAVILVAGTAATGAGAYFVKGGTDLVASSDAPIESFTSYRAIADVGEQASGTFTTIGGTPAAIFAYEANNQLQMTAFEKAELTIAGDHATALPLASGQLVAVRPIAFPGGNIRLAVISGDDVHHADLSNFASTAFAVNPMPAANLGAWHEPQVVTSFASGADQVAAVASRMSIDTSTIPTKPPEQGGMFTWSNVRTGAAWIGQTAADLGTGREAVIGFAPGAGGAGQLCAIDPSTAGAGACVATMIMAPSDVAVLAGKIDTDAMTDVAIVQGGSSGAIVQFAPNPVLSGSTLGGPTLLPAKATPITNARAALYSNGVLLVGKDGATACVGLMIGAVGACK